MNEDARDSSASRGSVAGGPLGWAVVNKDGTAVRFAGSFLTLANSATQDDEIVPLYRKTQPTLTDSERKAIRFAAGEAAAIAEQNPTSKFWPDHAVCLRSAAERLG